MVETDSIQKLKSILWGNEIRQEVFQRWTQGFVFSEKEPTALEQLDGGPCAVIAPVQAFILKNLLYSNTNVNDWRHPTEVELNTAFSSALCNILEMVFADAYVLVNQSDEPANPDISLNLQQPEALFHNFTFTCFQNSEELKAEINNRIETYRSQYGVLLFLYSVLLTKGIEKLKNEIVDLDETLISSTFGHGSQNLINLLLTGRAVSYVWDNEKEVSGFKMNGILNRTQIGFLTLLEHLRYCEVGWFLKNPLFPIWLLASETHLTVFFSQDDSIVSNNNPANKAKQIFSKFDQENRGFINSNSLEDVMKELDLFADPLYVKIMSEKLDPEQLGIITLTSFINEFYPDESNENIKKWPIFHYNGLARSNIDSHVVYSEGICEVSESPELQMMLDHSAIKKCLLTKWPTIDVKWTAASTPSIN